MPDLFLDPIAKKDEKGEVVSVTDPAADIVAFLLASSNDWQPGKTSITKLDDSSRGALNKLLLDYLKENFYETAAEKYAKSGIPAVIEKELKGAEKELITKDGTTLSDDQKLIYIGRKSISKYGCYACHDIPGFEDGKPIGTALADWGKKDPSKLAFEHITHYLHASEHQDGHGHAKDPAEASMPQFYMEQLEAGHRTGFLFHMLTEPRRYDYLTTEDKRYNERLRMPQFPFSVEEREDLIAFVIGLIADPPASKFVYKPDAHAEAMIAGRQALDKFNCARLPHADSAEKWKVSYAPGGFGEQPATVNFPFLGKHYTPEQWEASKKVDHRGLLTAHLTGMPSLNDADGKANINDSEGDLIDGDAKATRQTSLTYPFELWSPVAARREGIPSGCGAVEHRG